MWLLPTIRNEIVTIAFHSDALMCSWISTSPGSAPYELKAYNRYPIQKLELNQLTIFNPTRIKKYISAFLTTHSLTQALTYFALADPAIFQTVVDLPTASPTQKDFDALPLKKLVWDFCYMFPKDDGHSFYVCGLTQRMLFQYKLLALDLPIHLIGITTESMALFRLYAHMQGSAFRPAQLARDMEKNNYQLKNYFTHDLMRRMLYVPHSMKLDSQKEMDHLISSLGLFLAGKQHENY